MSGRDPDKQYMTHPPAVYGGSMYHRACLNQCELRPLRAGTLHSQVILCLPAATQGRDTATGTAQARDVVNCLRQADVVPAPWQA